MKIKVCGMRQPDNIDEVASLGIDMMGFIFYPKSPRFAGTPDRVIINALRSRGVMPVGVFVDEDSDTVVDKMEHCGFTAIQLHGNECVDYCDLLRQRGFTVLKAISIAGAEDIAKAAGYDGHADMLVLDTKCAGKGGSGVKFDWKLLAKGGFTTPFLLSGGISAEDIDSVTALYHSMSGLMAGVDLNSRFETEPGIKSPEILREFIDKIRAVNRG
ncbi:MAG: phosphoribosylanthranilate isomerase [Muribaculaceae bacterium]|nr:phosphoribosylanthranilate isomerase [Muribaculaceae bacterium]